MKKLLNKKGFTLMEMMIVIAIIVILIAIAVPSFNNSLDKANKTTDAANFQAAETAGALKAMDKANFGQSYVYQLTTGQLVPVASAAATDNGSCSKHADNYIVVSIAADGQVTVEWSDDSVNCD